ncbi:MAG TPA: hypothetical protein VN961_03235 [Streptosporangiaceae bacterium]|nr:hypothetical protein [Streptosporangiaceae bacterium]
MEVLLAAVTMAGQQAQGPLGLAGLKSPKDALVLVEDLPGAPVLARGRGSPICYPAFSPRYATCWRRKRVAVVGPMAEAGEFVLGPIRTAIQRNIGPNEPPDLVLGTLGSRHTALGAIALALGESDWLLVPDLAAAHQRIYQHSLPLEDARAQAAYGQHSSVGKVLEIHQELPGRIHIVLIRQPVGF